MSYQHKGNTAPYHDDFDRVKNFFRIMFNPARAVQARELTQAQTLLQNQVGEFASHVFKDGAPVTGARISFGTKQPYMRVQAQDEDGTDVNIALFVGRTLLGRTSGQKALVTKVDVSTRTLYFSYLGSSFSNGEKFDTVDLPLMKCTMQSGTLGYCTAASCTEGTIYYQGYFVHVPAQTVIVTTATTGTFHVGFVATNDFVTTADDPTLADPAQGYYNYNAPGADRLRVSMVLDSYLEGDSVKATPEYMASFVPGIIITDGVLYSAQMEDPYADIMDMLAKRTFDESGSYTVNPWKVQVKNATDPETLDLSIQPGEGYVNGFHVKTIVSKLLNIPRPRTTGAVTNFDAYVSDYPFTYVLRDQNTAPFTAWVANKFPSFNTFETLEVMTGLGGTGTKLGECRVVSAYKEGLDLLIYLSDISSVVNSWPGARSCRSKTTPANYFNLKLNSAGLAQLYGSPQTRVFSLAPYNTIQAIPAGSVEYDFVKTYTASSASSGNSVTIVESDNGINFSGLSNVLAIYNTSTGAIIDHSALTVTPNNSSKPSSVVLAGAAITNSTGLTIILRVRRLNGSVRVKTLQTAVENITVTSGTNSFTLAQEDLLDVVSITQTSNIKGGVTLPDFKNVLTVYDGQTDSYYTPASLSGFNGTEANSYKNNTGASTNYTVTYRYFTHSGSGPFAANSYTTAGNLSAEPNIYNLIHKFQTSAGQVLNLRDCLDFRPKASEASSGGPEVPCPRTNIEVDINYYLPRRDLVWVDKSGAFGVTQGIPAIPSVTPLAKDGTMAFCELIHSPYVGDLTGVNVSYLNNQRYTMADIGALADRLTTIEDTVSLSLLEQKASTVKIVDTNGLDKYKSGIFTDPGTDFDRSNYTDPDFRSTIDAEEGTIRAPFTVIQKNFTFDNGSSTQVTRTGVGVTLPFTEAMFLQNTAVSEFHNVQEYLFYVWNGAIDLVPSIDTWVTDLGNTATYSAFQDNTVTTPRPPSTFRWWGWDQWRTDYSAQNHVVTTVTHMQSTDRFMRQRTVAYTARGMRPGIHLTATLDGVPVTLSNDLVDVNGVCSGTFTVPANIPVGQRLFAMYDAAATTTAAAPYTANGITIWTETLNTTMRDWTPSETYLGWFGPRGDPIAESFMVEEAEGIFLTSVDLFFHAKDDGAAPVFVYVVTMENGIPSQNVIPFSHVSKSPADVNLGVNTPTTFTFSTPLYLAGGKEYAFVVASSSLKYEIYASTMGRPDLNTGIGIAYQPFLGSMFKSQNATTWDPRQASDLKFTLRKAVFNTAVNGSAIFNVEGTSADVLVASQNLAANVLTVPGATSATSFKWKSDSTWTPFTNGLEVFNSGVKTLAAADTAPTSLSIKIDLATASANVSPQIDTEAMYAILTTNSTIATGDGTFPWDAGTYISQTVNLSNPAQDIRVILDMIAPGYSDIDVYFSTVRYQPMYVTQSTNGAYGIDTTDAAALANKTCTIYYWDTTANTWTPKSQVQVVGYDAITKKVYLSTVGNPTDFVAITAADASTNTYTGQAATIQHILISNIASTTALTVLPWGAGTSFAQGALCSYGGYIWQKATSGTSTTGTPSTVSTTWTKVPVIRTISTTLNETDTVWRPMNKAALNSSVDTLHQFVEYTFTPRNVPEAQFKQFAIKIQMKAKNQVDIPRIKNIRAIAAL